MDYYIEKFNGKIEELAILFQTDSPEGSDLCDKEYLKWLYFENPIGKAIIVCARTKSSSQLVAIYIVNPVLYYFNGKAVKGGLSLNTFTRKEFRGKGLFPKLAQLCYQESLKEGLSYIIGFPNAASYPGFIKKLEFIDLGNVGYYIKVISPVGSVLKKVGIKFQRRKEFSTIQKENIVIREIMDDDWLNLDLFLQKYKSNRKITNYRNNAYLKWRYKNHPSREYRIIGCWSQNELIGYTVLSSKLSSWLTDGYIVDLCLAEDSALESLYSRFVDVIVDYFNKNGVDIIKVFLNEDSHEHHVLKSKRFFPKAWVARNSDLPFIYRDLSGTCQNYEFMDWNLSLGDCDVV